MKMIKMKNEFNYSGKYQKKIVLSVLKYLHLKLPIREISKLTGVPETTIRNWKFGYTNIYGEKNKLNLSLKKQVISRINNGSSIPKVAKDLNINYELTRLFLKNELLPSKYDLIKVSNRKLRDEAKKISPELSYILGVMYGDGHFGVCQIRLGAKDKDFVDYFSNKVKEWSKKRPSVIETVKNNKPYYTCHVSFKEVSDFIKKTVGNREKIPRSLVLSKNNQIITMFIRGFNDSEGTFISTQKYSSNWLKMYNQKITVLKEIKNLMIKIGFDKDKVQIIKNNEAKNGPVYAIRICYIDQIKLFYEKIGFTIKRKQKKLELCLKNKQLL